MGAKIKCKMCSTVFVYSLTKYVENSEGKDRYSMYII